MTQDDLVTAIKRVTATHEWIHTAVKDANVSDVFDNWIVEASRRAFVEALCKIFEKAYH